MAQSRMLNKCISLSERVADLKSDQCRLLYTWIIPHADDFGLVVSSPRKIKATVFPMVDCTAEDIGNHLEDMESHGLIKRLTYGERQFWFVIGHESKQTLKKDRQPQTILGFPMVEDKNKNWKTGQDIVNGIHLESNGFHLEPEVKGSEEKRREVKGRGSVKEKPFAAIAADNNFSLAAKYKQVLESKKMPPPAILE
jgi:hypothetical protein